MYVYLSSSLYTAVVHMLGEQLSINFLKGQTPILPLGDQVPTLKTVTYESQPWAPTQSWPQVSQTQPDGSRTDAKSLFC